MTENKWSPVVKLKVLGDYTFKIDLENGDAYFVDMKRHFMANRKMDQEIRKTFDQVKIDEFGGLVWPDGWDMCADWIIAYGVKVEEG